VPLKLVTGPANAAKAGEVLGGLRARLDEDPVLVVPTFADVEHSQRELADRGAIFGARVMRFEWLFGEIAKRAGFDGRRASEFQRELIVEEAVRRTRLEVLAESAAQPGFVRAAARFFAELGRVRNEVSAARLTRALRDWAGEGPRRSYAEEIAAIYRAYREGLDRAGLLDEELYAWGALNALRAGGARTAWGRTPVFVYGFDDFDGLQLDALETLARHCDVDVTVSLPYEPGRLAFKAVSGVHQELLAMGAGELALAPLDDHYADASRAALHHIERSLFEDDATDKADPGSAVSFHSAGGERAEVELVAARLRQLLRDGVTPGDVAVVFREPGRYSSLIEQVFGAYGIPYSIARCRSATPASAAACWR
jgi:ATP-dependent helicase/DNAse subunit B